MLHFSEIKFTRFWRPLPLQPSAYLTFLFWICSVFITWTLIACHLTIALHIPPLPWGNGLSRGRETTRSWCLRTTVSSSNSPDSCRQRTSFLDDSSWNPPDKIHQILKLASISLLIFTRRMQARTWWMLLLKWSTSKKLHGSTRQFLVRFLQQSGNYKDDEIRLECKQDLDTDTLEARGH